ncbi:MAG TPA: glycoside hydrolase domain-containing protein [Granulicella sp.]
MRAVWMGVLLGTVAVCGCSRSGNAARATDSTPATFVQPQPSAASSPISASAQSVGFDRNDYPGDETMSAMRKDFAFTGYWLTTPPGDDTNTWTGKRELLKQQGWGFLVLANGKLEAEILKAKKAGTSPTDLGRKDAAGAVAAAKSEQFPAHTIVFLDQEEGGRLTDVQAAYLLAWTEAVAASDFRPGVYASGQRVQDDPGVWIDTVQDIRERIKKGGLHEVAIFDAQDECPPAPGCTLQAKPLSEAGEPDLTAWQYSQSPRRPSITKSCAKTYAADGNCYAPGFSKVFLDMNVADSPDPSHGR